MSDSSERPTDEDTAKPRSVRESLGSSGRDENGDRGSGRKPTPVRSGGPVPARDPGDEGDAQRPTPVREAMEAERERRQPVEPPSLRFEVDGEEWIARVEGRTATGRALDAGAPLLFLTFARVEDPDRRLRETVAVGRRLDDFGPSDLGLLFTDAGPYEGSWEGSELFPETRKSRKSRS